jgi:hypothetical protein
MANLQDMLSQLDALKAGNLKADARPQWELVGATFVLSEVTPQEVWEKTNELKADGSPKWKNVGYRLDENQERVRCDIVMQLTDAEGRNEGHVQLADWLELADIQGWAASIGKQVEVLNPRIVCTERLKSKEDSTFANKVYGWRFEHDGIKHA